MPRTLFPGLRASTGFNASQWNQRITKLYGEAKRRNGGNSLTIYGEVTEMLDILEGVMPPPADYDIGRELNELAGRLRRV